MVIAVFLVLGLLAFGVLIGGIAGGIITGDWRYTIVWAVALAALVLCLVVVAMGGFSRASGKSGTAAKKLPTALRRTLAIVLVIVGAAATLFPAGDAISRIGTNQSFLTGPNQQRAVDSLAQLIGSHQLVDIDFYDGYVIAQAPSKPGADTTDDFEYQFGRSDRLGPEPGSRGRTKDVEYDGSVVNFSVIPKLIADAEKRAKLTAPTDIHVSVMQGLDAKPGSAPVINVDLEDDYGSAQVHYSAAGKFLDGDGDAFTG